MTLTVLDRKTVYRCENGHEFTHNEPGDADECPECGAR